MPAVPLLLTLNGTTTADILAQPDDLLAQNADDITITILALGGNDTLTAYSGPSDWPDFATDPTDTLTIANHLFGGYGNDTFISSTGLPGLTPDQTAHYTHADTLDGGYGNDTYIVNDINVVIRDSYGTNTLVITQTFAQTTGLTAIQVSSFSPFSTQDIQNITVQGTADFEITGDSSDNRLTGNAGQNAIYGNGGDDTLSGRGGDDVVIGASGNCMIFGGEGSDFMRGNGDQDTLFGGLGDDRMYGDGGNDMLHGGKGQDLMSGQEGDDFYVVNRNGDVVEEADAQGFDTVATANLDLDASHFDHVEALLATGQSSLFLLGGNAVVRMTGNDASNMIIGADAAETLSGAGGDDAIWGFAGADVIEGGSGADKMTGGADADTFLFASGSDMVSLDGQSRDILMDFVSGQDLIDLRALGTVQVLDGAFDGSGVSSVIFFDDVVQTLDLGVTTAIVVAGDTNGDGTEDFRFYLNDSSGTTTLTATDFLLAAEP